MGRGGALVRGLSARAGHGGLSRRLSLQGGIRPRAERAPSRSAWDDSIQLSKNPQRSHSPHSERHSPPLASLASGLAPRSPLRTTHSLQGTGREPPDPPHSPPLASCDVGGTGHSPPFALHDSHGHVIPQARHPPRYGEWNARGSPSHAHPEECPFISRERPADPGERIIPPTTNPIPQGNTRLNPREQATKGTLEAVEAFEDPDHAT